MDFLIQGKANSILKTTKDINKLEGARITFLQKWLCALIAYITHSWTIVLLYGMRELSKVTSNQNSSQHHWFHMSPYYQARKKARSFLGNLDSHRLLWNLQNGNTPLQLAASKGHLEFVKLLVKAGASPNIQNEVRFLARAFKNLHEKRVLSLFLSILVTHLYRMVMQLDPRSRSKCWEQCTISIGKKQAVHGSSM